MKSVLGKSLVRGRCIYGWVLLATAVVLTLSGAAPTGAAKAAAVSLPGRAADPVVLTGDQTPKLSRYRPERIVAFRWRRSWKQVPVQIDERKVVDYRAVRGGAVRYRPFSNLAYADPGTYAGADDEPRVDDDDEIVMMARDSGVSGARAVAPPGVLRRSRTPVRITDPLDRHHGFLYLFVSKSGLDPAAGRDYVDYDFQLLAGDDYFLSYDFARMINDAAGPPGNPESSIVRTDYYSQRMPARWMSDTLRIKTGSANGTDILDGEKITVGTRGCFRNELTFARGGGGFIANIDGPVRAIRSFIGANSGTYTQRDQVFYERRQDTTSYSRVHASFLGSVISATDYSSGALGMTYRNSLNPEGVTIDGRQDAVVPGKYAWDEVSGPQGSVISVGSVTTDIPRYKLSSFYLDSADPPGDASFLCSGDDHAYGVSGSWATHSGPNTDPTLPPTPPNSEVNHSQGTRTSFYERPNVPAVRASIRSEQYNSPLTVATGAGVDRPKTPGRNNRVGLRVSVKPKHARVKVGATRKFKVKVRNIGDLAARRIRVCPIVKRKPVRTTGCRKLRKLKPGKGRRFRFGVTVRRVAAGRKFKLRFRAKASRGRARSTRVKLTVPFGR